MSQCASDLEKEFSTGCLRKTQGQAGLLPGPAPDAGPAAARLVIRRDLIEPCHQPADEGGQGRERAGGQGGGHEAAGGRHDLRTGAPPHVAGPAVGRECLEDR